MITRFYDVVETIVTHGDTVEIRLRHLQNYSITMSLTELAYKDIRLSDVVLVGCAADEHNGYEILKVMLDMRLPSCVLVKC